MYARAAERIRHRVYHTDLPAAGAAVVTRPRGGRWETRIVGGRLDAFPVASRDWPEAAEAHRWAVRLALEAAGAGGAADSAEALEAAAA